MVASARHEPFSRLPREFDASLATANAVSAYRCHDEYGAPEFGFVEDLHPTRHEPEQSVRAQLCSLPPFRGCRPFHPLGEGREPCRVNRFRNARLMTSGLAANAKKLDPSPRSLPPLVRVEDSHGHGWVGQQVPAMKGSGVRQEVQLEVRRIREERGVDVGSIPSGDRRDRAEFCLGQDAQHDRPNPPLRDAFSCPFDCRMLHSSDLSIRLRFHQRPDCSWIRMSRAMGSENATRPLTARALSSADTRVVASSHGQWQPRPCRCNITAPRTVYSMRAFEHAH